MKVINDGSQSKVRAGASACPVIRRILKEHCMHAYMPAKKTSVIQRMACASHARRVSCRRALCFTTTVGGLLYARAGGFLLRTSDTTSAFNFDDDRLISLSQIEADPVFLNKLLDL
jgi:hypothetical protein